MEIGQAESKMCVFPSRRHIPNLSGPRQRAPKVLTPANKTISRCAVGILLALSDGEETNNENQIRACRSSLRGRAMR